MRTLYIILLLSTAFIKTFAQGREPSLQSLLNRNNKCAFDGPTVTLDTANYAESRNVSYSYSYLYPKYFKEVWPQEKVESEIRKKSDAYIDTITYVGPQGDAQLKIFAGQAISFPVEKKRLIKASNIIAVDKAVSECIKRIKAGNDAELGKVKITDICKGVKGYQYTICVKATRGDVNYLYKIIVAEMPASDELIFSHLLYQYKTASKDKYEAIGITLANSFKAD